VNAIASRGKFAERIDIHPRDLKTVALNTQRLAEGSDDVCSSSVFIPVLPAGIDVANRAHYVTVRPERYRQPLRRF
jgi:hypothetical protein